MAKRLELLFKLSAQERERFESKFVRGEPDACWPWLGTCFANGYAAFWFDKQNRLATRIMYVLFVGEIPTDRPWILHSCDGGANGCVNPNHLYAGTPIKNMVDRNVRNRWSPRKGDTHPMAKLTCDIVRAVRREYQITSITAAELAARHGVTKRIMEKALAGQNWKHVIQEAA